jgi:hypothetical protein
LDFISVLFDQVSAHLGGLSHEVLAVIIDDFVGLLRVVFLSILRNLKRDVSQLGAKTQTGHLLSDHLVSLLQVVGGSCCDLTEEFLFGNSSRQDSYDLISKLFQGLKLVLWRKVLGKPEGAFGSRNDGQFEERIGSLKVP